MSKVIERAERVSDTNLPGVTAVQWGGETSSTSLRALRPADRVVADLLGPLDLGDERIAALRDKLASRDWPADARIVPHLTPQIGVTHLLTPPRKVSDAAYTSNNWAGSTIAGTWQGAVGTWRVPAISIPSTPAGTDGGWDSSSWVGIDGTYGSNDVLQAGVQQSIAGDGSTTFVAWYEWYAPKVDGSPDYIYQTNIDNMPIQPGDEVFVNVHYQDGQGYVMFGNVDRGKYFSIQLASPPGATFSGNSVEWIVEAFNTGEPGTSLPRFAPVNFTSAVGSDTSAMGSGDPANGDTTDIVAYGRPLTSVTLNTLSLTVQYLDAGFFPLPGAAVFDHEKQQVAAVSRASGNLDLFVIGFDNHVWSTYWNETAGWAPDWFPLPGAAVFDHEKQQIAAVSRAPGNLDVFVVGNESHVWSSYWNEQNGWAPDFFPLPGAAVFDQGHQQVAAVSRAPGNLDLFIIGNDGHVWSTYWNSNGWAPDWFPLPGAAVFDRINQKVAVVSRAPGNLDVFVVGFESHVWSSYWNDQNGWAPDFFPLPGAAVFDEAHQHVAVVSRVTDSLDLFIIGNDGHIWTTYWNSSGWSPNWYPLPGAAVFDPINQQVAAVTRAPGNLDLFVIGNDSRVWTTYWNDQAGWSADFFPLPGGAVFDRIHQRLAAVSRASGNLDLFVIGNENHVWTEYWNDRVGWN
jgi:hypothetical protein